MLTGRRPHKAKVGDEGSIEQNRVARQITDVPAQILQLNVPDVFPSKPDRSANRVIEPRDQFCQCALARSILAGHGDVFPRQDSKSRNVKHVLLSLIAKLNRIEFDLGPIMLRKVDGTGGICHARAQSESGLHLSDTGEGFLSSRVEVSGAAERFKQLRDEPVECYQTAKAQPSCEHALAAVANDGAHGQNNRQGTAYRKPNTSCE